MKIQCSVQNYVRSQAAVPNTDPSNVILIVKFVFVLFDSNGNVRHILQTNTNLNHHYKICYLIGFVEIFELLEN
jgi:hypothetical protein